MSKFRHLMSVRSETGYETLCYSPYYIKPKIGDMVILCDEPKGAYAKNYIICEVQDIVTIEVNSPVEKFMKRCANIDEIQPIWGIVKKIEDERSKNDKH